MSQRSRLSFLECISALGPLAWVLNFPGPRWWALPYRRPSCRPAATQVKGDGRDLRQHQLCLLQLQRPQLVSALALLSLLSLRPRLTQRSEDPATISRDHCTEASKEASLMLEEGPLSCTDRVNGKSLEKDKSESLWCEPCKPLACASSLAEV